MTQPRRLLEHATYMVTRRCSERRFFLRPEAIVIAIFEFLFAIACARYGVQVIAISVTSNHYHAVIVDVEGKLAKFMQFFNGTVGRALNAHLGRGENFWAPGSYNASEIEVEPIFDEETLLEKLLYVWTNCVKDGLVERPEHWPGLLSSPEDMGKHQVQVLRPEQAFFGGSRPPDWKPTYESRRARLDRYTRRKTQPKRAAYTPKESTLPKVATLEICLPKPWRDDPDGFRQRAREALEARLVEIHAARKANGLSSYLGAPAILAQNPFDAPGGSTPDFGLNPALAPGHDPKESKRRKRSLSEFRALHRSALRRWREGDRTAIFPRGTYRMRVLHKARVAGKGSLDTA